MVWGIVKDGRLVHVKGAGVQDVEAKRPVTADTLFRMGAAVGGAAPGVALVWNISANGVSMLLAHPPSAVNPPGVSNPCPATVEVDLARRQRWPPPDTGWFASVGVAPCDPDRRIR